MTVPKLIIFSLFIFASLMGMFLWGLEGAPRDCSSVNAWDQALQFNAEQRHRLIGAWNQRAVEAPTKEKLPFGPGDGPEKGTWELMQKEGTK